MLCLLYHLQQRTKLLLSDEKFVIRPHIAMKEVYLFYLGKTTTPPDECTDSYDKTSERFALALSPFPDLLRQVQMIYPRGKN